jgi:hypothetical protein
VADAEMLYGMPGGLLGLALNVVICVAGSYLPPRGAAVPSPADGPALAKTGDTG